MNVCISDRRRSEIEQAYPTFEDKIEGAVKADRKAAEARTNNLGSYSTFRKLAFEIRVVARE